MAWLPRAPDTCDTSVSGLVAGALTSTAMLRARPSRRPRFWSMMPSTPAIPSTACAPTVSRVLLAAVTGYRRPLTSRAVRPAATLVIRSPAAKPDQTRASPAVVGGSHGRSADALAASTVSCAPLTEIFAPSMASTARTPGSLRSRFRSAAVTPPGTEAMTSGTTRWGVVAPVRVACGSAPRVPLPVAPLLVVPRAAEAVGLAVAAALAAALALTLAALASTRAAPVSAPADGAAPPERAATVAATAAQTATSPPPMTTGRARRLMVSRTRRLIVSSLTVSQLYKASGRRPSPCRESGPPKMDSRAHHAP